MMKPTISLAVAAVLSLLLSACAGTTPAQSSQSSHSGVTVFGTVDVNVNHTR